MLTLTDAEVKTFDTELEPVLEWAKTRSVEAEQLALDCARLLSCTEDRLDQIKGQGFFRRCWGQLSGKTGEMERANTSDLILMQKASLRYIGLLQERQLMMAHSMLTLKNNLVALAVKEEETRLLILDLANNALKRFQELENRVDQLAISTNLQGWVLTLEERGYEEKFKTNFFRMFRIVNDFYNYKSDEWNYTDILFLRKALKLVGIDPKMEISIQEFVEKSIEEILYQGFDIYEDLVLSQFVDRQMGGELTINSVSSNYFTAIHALLFHYIDKSEIVETLSEELSVSKDIALKKIITRTISRLNVDVSKTLPLSDIAIEILGGIRLANMLIEPNLVGGCLSNVETPCEDVAAVFPATSEKDGVDEADSDNNICSFLVDALGLDKNKTNFTDYFIKGYEDICSPLNLCDVPSGFDCTKNDLIFCAKYTVAGLKLLTREWVYFGYGLCFSRSYLCFDFSFLNLVSMPILEFARIIRIERNRQKDYQKYDLIYYDSGSHVEIFSTFEPKNLFNLDGNNYEKLFSILEGIISLRGGYKGRYLDVPRVKI